MKQTERNGFGTYAFSAMRGAAGFAVFLLLLLIAAFMSEKATWLMNGAYQVPKVCLLLGGIVSGGAALKKGEKRRLLHALSGEAALLCLVAAVAAFSVRDGAMLSFLTDCVILLFGAFAGTQLCSNRRIQQRGKRKYRA